MTDEQGASRDLDARAVEESRLAWDYMVEQRGAGIDTSLASELGYLDLPENMMGAPSFSQSLADAARKSAKYKGNGNRAIIASAAASESAKDYQPPQQPSATYLTGSSNGGSPGVSIGNMLDYLDLGGSDN
ncbi:hypothetical protein ACFL0W_05890 [Nanoarchaeota archaeon]